MVNIKRVVDQFGNQVKLCCQNNFLFFSEDNKFLTIDEQSAGSFNVDGSIFYQIASRISGRSHTS